MFVKRTLSVITSIALTVGSSLILAQLWAESSLASPSITNNAIAQNPSPGREERQNQRRSRMMEQLNLTEAQKQQMDAIRKKYGEQARPLMTQLRQELQQLSQMLGGNSSDDAIRAKRQEIVQLRQKLDNIRFDGLLETRGILNPQQRIQLSQMMQKMRHSSGDKPPQDDMTP